MNEINMNRLVDRARKEVESMIAGYKEKLIDNTQSLNIKSMQNITDTLEILKYTNIRINTSEIK